MDIKSLIEGVEKLLSYMFGGNVPVWLLPTIAWSIATGLVISGLGFVFRQMKQFWKEFMLPIFYDPEQKRQRLQRQRFADYIESEIRRLNTQEAWNDHRFTELDAEVETQGQTRLFGLFSLPEIFTRTSLRRERSLSIAIEKNSARLMIIEGDPGSGKSVALRHVAQGMAAKASHSRNLKQPIPFYINLKGLKRTDSVKIDRSLIEQFVLKTINRVNDRDVEEYLNDEFRNGLKNGTWFFLFDSFDEIPDILSSTGSDETIRAYADAISDFLQGLNQCRGVLASREYKGPRYLSWSKLRILQLSARRRRELISRTGLPIKIQDAINGGLSLASPDFRFVASNPMFLNLLCEYMYTKGDNEFPEHTHLVFEKYIWHRLTRDRERISQKFEITPENVREAAEKLAFCMTADYALGLNPTKKQLKESAKKLGFDFGERFEIFTNALEYLKLARTEESVSGFAESTFTFSHRRFQEYFATSIVIREPQRVPALEMLTNLRWRETAVVILQAKQSADRQFLIDAAVNFIRTLYSSSETFNRDKIEFAKGTLRPIANEINWHPSLLHILEILQSGLNIHVDILPRDVQEIIDNILSYAMQFGLSLDKKWVLGVSGVASDKVQETILLTGLRSQSEWLQNEVYEQLAQIAELSESMKYQLRCVLISMSARRKLFEKRKDLYAQLSKSEATKDFKSIVRILAWAPYIDIALAVISIGLLHKIFSDPIIELFVASIQLSLLWARWHYDFLGLGRFDSFVQSQFFLSLGYGAGAYVILGFLVLAVNPDHLISVFGNIFQNAPLSWLYLIGYISLNLWMTMVISEIYNTQRFSLVGIPAYSFYRFMLGLAPYIGAGLLAIFWNKLASQSLVPSVSRIAIYGIWLLPLLFLIWILRLLVLNWFFTESVSWKAVRETLLILLFVLGIPVGLLVSIGFFLKRVSWAPQATLIIIFGVLPLLIVIPWGIEFAHDYHKYYRLWGRNKKIIDTKKLISLLACFRSELVRIQVIRDVRQSKLIDINESNAQILKVFLVFVEFCLAHGYENANQYLELHSSELDELKDSTGKAQKDSQIYKWSTRQLDELCKLYEQISI